MHESAPEMPEAPKPSLTLDGEHAEPLMDYDVGHTCKLTGDFKVVSKSDHDAMGPSIRLEATGPLTPAEGKGGLPEGSAEEEASETPSEEAEEQNEGDEDEGDEEEKILGYKRPTKKSEPAPGASAKDLED